MRVKIGIPTGPGGGVGTGIGPDVSVVGIKPIVRAIFLPTLESSLLFHLGRNAKTFQLSFM